jgi:hypothetical protein
MAMVSSYLVCEVCGSFGPPAGFLKEDGLRLCYQCWYQQWREHQSSTAASDAESNEGLPADSLPPIIHSNRQNNSD